MQSLLGSKQVHSVPKVSVSRSASEETQSPAAQPSDHAAGMQNTELRIEIESGAQYLSRSAPYCAQQSHAHRLCFDTRATLQLLKGSAEVFGTELFIGRPVRLQGQKLAVRTCLYCATTCRACHVGSHLAAAGVHLAGVRPGAHMPRVRDPGCSGKRVSSQNGFLS